MLSYKPTEEELTRLREYISRELTITVHVDEAFWEYGNVERSEYDANYRMKLEDATIDRIVGIITEGGTSPQEKEWKYRGRLMTQPFSLHGSGSLPWEAGTSKAITLIQHNDKILYDRIN